MKARGCDKSSYPYKERGNCVLVYWNEADFHQQGNNLPKNVKPSGVAEIAHKYSDIYPTKYTISDNTSNDDGYSEDSGDADDDMSQVEKDGDKGHDGGNADHDRSQIEKDGDKMHDAAAS